MLGLGGNELREPKAAVARFQARERRLVDPKELRAVIDALEAGFFHHRLVHENRRW
jgi:hypothetical protein